MANTKGSSSALMISKLFKGKSGKSDKKFDPKAECVVASQIRKKKACNTRMKPKSVSVVIVNDVPSIVPKGRIRSKLTKSNQIAKISLRRSMSSSEVRRAIVDAFPAISDVETAKFLCCNKDNTIIVNDNQLLNGDEAIELAGQGSLYLTRSKTDVTYICTVYYSYYTTLHLWS